jgi:multidrug efflux pump subunit AcrB
VTAAAIADTLRVATSGDYDQSLAKLNLSQRQVPIVVRLPGAGAHRPGAAARACPCPGATGPVMLGNVATLEHRQRPGGPSTATTASATSNFEIELNQRAAGRGEGRGTGAAQPAAAAAGRDADRASATPRPWASSFASFGLAMLTGVLCIYIVLVLLFKDFVQPATILGALRAVDPGRPSWRCSSRQRRCSMPSHDRADHAHGDRHEELDPADRLRDHRPARPGPARFDALLDACRKRARPSS